MNYYKRIFTLYDIGVEIPNDIKDYIDNVKMIFENLSFGSFISNISERRIYQLYSENNDIHFEIKTDKDEKLIYVFILDTYESKFNKHIEIFPYLFISFFYNTINNCYISEKGFIRYYVSQSRLGKVREENK